MAARSLNLRVAEQTRPTDAPLPAVTTPAGRPVWYPDTAVLTRADVAAVLDVDETTVRRYPIRCAFPSRQTPRYLFRDVVAFLDARAA